MSFRRGAVRRRRSRQYICSTSALVLCSSCAAHLQCICSTSALGLCGNFVLSTWHKAGCEARRLEYAVLHEPDPNRCICTGVRRDNAVRSVLIYQKGRRCEMCRDSRMCGALHEPGPCRCVGTRAKGRVSVACGKRHGCALCMAHSRL